VLVRKLRIEKGWSQETLAEISGLSVRTIQRIERGGNASLESLGALAAVFEVDFATLATETSMYKQQELPEEEREAVEYVRDIKGFYSHLAFYIVAVAAMAATNLYMGTDNLWFIWPTIGWGMGVATHGLVVFEVLSLFGVDWEMRQIKKQMQLYRS
jgi:transcriptional regulator with XRE-family HTH domain